jgi:Cache 3/Cache 2 fusion domain
MGRINLIAWLSVCFIALTPSVGATQTDNVKTSMAALQAETAKLGAPKVQGSDLYFGNTKASNDLVRAMKKEHGAAATIFVKSGDQYKRVATTVKKEDGTNAVGTALDANNPAIAKLNSGEPYYGDATVFGKTLRRWI